MKGQGSEARSNGAAAHSVPAGELPASKAAVVDRGDTLANGAVAVDPELLRDVLERVTEVLAHTAGAADGEPALEASRDITIDLPTQMVYRAGRPLRVTPTEFRLLAALMRRRGAVVSREELRREVWPDAGVQARVVDTHIARLRRKLEDDPRQPRYILTALAAGYRFRA